MPNIIVCAMEGSSCDYWCWGSITAIDIPANVRVTRPAPSHPDSFTETAGTRLLIVDMDVPKILALMVILLLNVQYSQTQGTYIGN